MSTENIKFKVIFTMIYSNLFKITFLSSPQLMSLKKSFGNQIKTLEKNLKKLKHKKFIFRK